jgi:hypothetical protein
MKPTQTFFPFILEGPDIRLRPEGRYCPYCGQSICKAETSDRNYKGMLSMHIKHIHPEIWRKMKGGFVESAKIRKRFQDHRLEIHNNNTVGSHQ